MSRSMSIPPKSGEVPRFSHHFIYSHVNTTKPYQKRGLYEHTQAYTKPYQKRGLYEHTQAYTKPYLCSYNP